MSVICEYCGGEHPTTDCWYQPRRYPHSDELSLLIYHWESVLKYSGYLLQPSDTAHLQHTIKYLKELKGVRDAKGTEQAD